jgi:DNA topoisomerase I
MKNLVIVESPTKAKTIGKFLGKDYEIRASMGHIMDLPKSTLGVDLEKNFEPQYEMVKDKSKIISELRSLGKNADNIILATDPDREGEAIASHVKDVLKDQKSKIKNQKFTRIVFHEITKDAIEEAIKNPREIDSNLVDAQTARRVLDRLVGYKLSPILWQKIRRGLSAGRVQSIALRLIAEREKEIEKFKKEKYFTIHAVLEKNKKETEFELIEIDGQKIELQKAFELYDGTYKITKTVIENIEEAQKITQELNSKKLVVSDVIKKQAKRSPIPAFTTSTLQQDASRRFGFSGKRTMGLAQKLYEEGYITYHRTDSVAMATTAIDSIRKYVEKEFGSKYVPESPRLYKTKQKLAQEAHEAIRPTNVSVSQASVSDELGREYAKLYDLIWKRAVASQMADAQIEQTSVIVDSDDRKYRLKTNGSVLIFDGFLKVNPFSLNDVVLPLFVTGDNLDAKSIKEVEHETQPPPRYNDASIISTLEEKGIGRPSTYATIISTIEARKYIERQEGRFIPTSIGVAVNDFLVANFSTIDDIPFTAKMEEELDEVASGDKKWKPVVKEFYEPFAKTLVSAKGMERVKIETEETGEICPTCGNNLVIRMGRFGKFLSCSTFPACKFTKPLVEDTGFMCPECASVADKDESRRGGKIILKRTRKGRKFYGCSNYPNCTYATWKLEDIKKKV